MTVIPLLIATENPGKLSEFQALLGEKFRCLTPLDPTLAKRGMVHIVEDGDTYFENALKKAVAYQRAYSIPVLSDDSGLEVDSLGGAPGVHSARYGGNEKLPWPARWKILHEALRPFAPDAWTARFRTVLCYYDGKNVPSFFQGTVEGRVLSEPKGSGGFGYDPIFFATSLNKSFGEVTHEEKQAHSHRAAAAREFLNWFRTSST